MRVLIFKLLFNNKFEFLLLGGAQQSAEGQRTEQDLLT
jgi:hypothetical protein